MKTKLTRTTEGVALVLGETMLDELGLNAGSEVEVSTSGRMLMMTPADDEDFQRSAEKIAAKYAGLFRRLAQ